MNDQANLPLAYKLALACVIEGLTLTALRRRPFDEQFEFADRHGLSADDLIYGLTAISELQLSRADALRQYRAAHGHS